MQKNDRLQKMREDSGKIMCTRVLNNDTETETYKEKLDQRQFKDVNQAWVQRSTFSIKKSDPERNYFNI